MPPDDTRPVTPSPDTFPAEREFVISRQLAATPEELFDAWTWPARLAKWWGPEGFTIPVAKNDPRPGGAYRLVMRSPQGTDFPMKGVYHELLRPSRLVMSVDLHEHPGEWQQTLREYRRDNEGSPLPEMALVVTFEPKDNGTLLTVRVRFGTRTERHAMLKMGMAEGWAQSLDRLAHHLAGGG